MPVRVGINGFGRIGRNLYRAAKAAGADIEFVAVNDVGDAKTMAHLLKYDSVLGPLDDDVEAGDGVIRVGDTEIRLLNEREPANLPWKDLGVQVAIESTGLFTKREQAQAHLEAGAEKVLISAPATDPDITIVIGVNDDRYDPEEHRIISNASCTTNCVAPVAKVIHDAWGIEQGFMTTIHAYTNDQRILDLPHKDLRRARAAAINLIPTSTGAAKAIGLVIPELQGKVDGISVRAPVPTGSITDLVVRVGSEVTTDEVNARFEELADTGPLEGILRYSTAQLVSTDIVGDSYSSIVDADQTMANGSMVKVMSWYDNEWGYSCRLVDLVERLLSRVPAAVGS
jgi:glyceraldehyde 3-phosphate dehydrogenase